MSQNAVADGRAERWRETMRYRRRLLQTQRSRIYRKAADEILDIGKNTERTQQLIRKAERQIREYNALAEELGVPPIRERKRPSPAADSPVMEALAKARAENPYLDAKFKTFQCSGCGYRTPSPEHMAGHLARTRHPGGTNGEGVTVALQDEKMVIK